MRSERTTSSAASTRPHDQEPHPAKPATLPPPVLSPQVTASEALRILASHGSSYTFCSRFDDGTAGTDVRAVTGTPTQTQWSGGLA